MYLVTAKEMRELDRLTIETMEPGHVLMERAGAGATETLLQSSSCPRDFGPHFRWQREQWWRWFGHRTPAEETKDCL
jgi:NAD(P)H-hydrate repair Nnr-like enzyme with NAD(P)H-hydrate epimerase domain